MNKESIAESILGSIDWNGTWGYCACPGEGLHQSRSRVKDCRILIVGAATLFCFHSSCQEMRHDVQKTIRKAIFRAMKEGEIPLQKFKRPPAKVDHARALRAKAKFYFDSILRDFQWPCQEIEADSPTKPPLDPMEQFHAHLDLFQGDDVVWIGNTFDSGEPSKVQHFQAVKDWKRFSSVPANFTCPSTFFEGTFKRSNSHVLKQRFLVVESDQLNFDEVGAVFRWLRDHMGLTLVTVIHSGGKSLHGWFVRPEEKLFQQLKIILPEFKCDPAMFKPAQPVRLAGAWREEKQQLQRMLYYVGF